MKKIFILLLMIAMTLGFTVQAEADLELLGQGTSTHGSWNLIYDSALDITWYDYRKYQNWDNGMNWADSLSVTFGTATHNNWRLPETFDETCGASAGGTVNCTNSEMGHLFYTTLGNSSGHGAKNYGDFDTLGAFRYRSATEYSGDSGNAFLFDFNVGTQHQNWKGYGYETMAVMDGRAVAPEPISSVLFLTGGSILGFRRFRKK